MPSVPSQIQLATLLCEAHPQAATKTLARRLYRENPERFKDLEAARSAVRRARGAHGEKLRKHATVEYNKGKAGWKPEMPPSMAEDWLPVKLPTGKILVFGDVHIPFHSEHALYAAVDWGVKWKPDVLLINGDFCDFYSISRFERNPKARLLADEVDMQLEGLAWLANKFPKAEKYFKMGNHEDRWRKYIWNKAPELWGLNACRMENLLCLADLGYTVVGDNLMMAGNLAVAHGHEVHTSSSISPARGVLLKGNHDILIAHHHKTSDSVKQNLFHQPTRAYSIGCLCALSPEYARINEWNNGFGALETVSSGDYDVLNLRIDPDSQIKVN